jgi:hypothetical protein
MAKVTLDPMFSGLSNRIGNFVHAKWKGMQVVKPYKPNRVASTAAQVEVRNSFRASAAVWKKLPAVIQKSWHPWTVGKAVTEFNLFIAENVKRQMSGVPYIITKGNGLDGINGLTADTSAPGEVSLNFNIVSEGLNLTVILQKISDGAGIPAIEIRPDVFTGTKPVRLKCLTAGEYFLYCIATDRVFAESGAVSESSGIRITVA